MNYDIEEFKKKYILHDFDGIFMVHNVDIDVNSNEYYLERKRHYMDETYKNVEILNKLTYEYNFINTNHKTSEKANLKVHTYTFIDYKRYNVLNQEIKEVYIKQNKLFANMISCINMLIKQFI